MAPGTARASGDGVAAPFRMLLRVPVPWMFVLGYLVGVALERVAPLPIRWPLLPDVSVVVGLMIFALGAAIAAWGWATFRVARTTTVPGATSAQMVTWGPYRFTRNPMYVGLTIGYAGEAVILRHVWPLILLPFVLAYVDRIVIPLEERTLAGTFGADYTTYRTRVRRWI
jgi:protein-S-isoprenylcysteine O-methyltransferase Ste14